MGADVTALWERAWSVTIGDADVSALDLDFTVITTARREPNTAELKLWNPAADTIARITDTSESAQVIIRAGYKGDGATPPTIFSGDIRESEIVADGPDSAMTIRAADAGRRYQSARMSQSYGPGSAVLTVLTDALDAMAVGRGNLAEHTIQVAGSSEYPEGYVASGAARDVAHAIIRASGLRWSIQGGALQLQTRGRALTAISIRLTPDTGLVGSPSRGNRGVVTARALMLADAWPGRLVSLESRHVSGDFMIEQVERTGATSGAEWYSDMELRAL